MGRVEGALLPILLVACVLRAEVDCSDHKYKEGDPVPLYANKVGPFHNPSVACHPFKEETFTKCPRKSAKAGAAMGRKGGSSWLTSVKRAFRSPSKNSEKNPELDDDISKKREFKRRCFFRKSSRYEQKVQLIQPSPSRSPEQMHVIEPAVTPACLTKEHYAAIVIQTAFRGYLARRALRALKGLVKVQALVRGHNVRKQANMTLQCMQSLVKVQNSVLDQRIRLSQSHYAAPHDNNIWDSLQEILERKSMKSRKGCIFTDDWDERLRKKEEIQAILNSAKEAVFKREKLNSYSSHQTWRSDYNLSLMNEELRGDPESQIWLDRWMASRTSFDSRSRSRSRGRASTDERNLIKTLEIDTARPWSYATPRQQPHYNPHHFSSPLQCSPATPSPPAKALPLQEWGSSMAAHSSARERAMPNYMVATESAKARLRSQSSPRPRPATPGRERAGSTKKQLSFPAPEAHSPSVKSAMGRLVSEMRSNVSSSCAESFGGESSPSSTTDLRRWLW